jgi:molecular chaperone DnaJ
VTKAAKNYYAILGIPRSASAAGIRARYRDLARALHPDVAGAQSTGAFQEIAEAYQVLNDPIARRRYNDELAAIEGRLSPDPRVDPRSRWRRAPSSPFPRPRVVRPPVGPPIEHVFRNFAGGAMPHREQLHEVDFEVILTPEEAARGAEVPVGLPRLSRCPECDGAGHVWLLPCLSCGGQGLMQEEDVIRIRIPPFRRPRVILDVPLHTPDLGHWHVRLDVRIE